MSQEHATWSMHYCIKCKFKTKMIKNFKMATTVLNPGTKSPSDFTGLKFILPQHWESAAQWPAGILLLMTFLISILFYIICFLSPGNVKDL